MPEVIDNEARDRIAKLYTQLRELQTLVYGDPVRRDGGIRQDVAELRTDVTRLSAGLASLEARFQHYLDVDRKDTCEGLRALAAHEADSAECLYEEQQEEEDMQIAKGQNQTTLRKARLELLGVIGAALLVLAGQVITTQQTLATQKEIVVLTQAVRSGGKP